MPFDISAGASAAAGSIATTAAEANLAADKWELEKKFFPASGGQPTATPTLPSSLIGPGGVSSQPRGP